MRSIRTQANRPDTLQTVERALLVLEQFTGREPERGLVEIADRLGVSKSMAHRLVTTLVERGFLAQNPRTRRYRLGLRLLGLGSIVGDQLPLRRVALPLMEDLARQVGETIFLTVRDRGFGMVAARVELQPSLNWVLGIGEWSDLWAGAANKIMLAHLPEAEREAIIATAPAPYGIDQLRADLAQIRERGWAFSVGEVTQYSAAVAVPIFAPDGEVLAGLSIAGPASRFGPERIADLVTLAQETAYNVARHYGNSEGAVG